MISKIKPLVYLFRIDIKLHKLNNFQLYKQ